MATALEDPIVDFLLLADRAEAVNGKLYLMGGGWDRLAVPDPNGPVPISLAVGVLIPWSATNDPHPFRVYFETEDGTPLQPQVGGEINVGRPPHAVRGQPFRTIIAVNGTWRLPGAGTYRAVVEVGESDRKRAVFHLRHATPTGAPAP
jgi:hypothetical protein